MFQDCLDHLRVVYHQWRDSSTVQIMFNSGIVVNIVVNPATGDISEIIFDKYMVGKLLSEYVGDGKCILWFCLSYILLVTHLEK